MQRQRITLPTYCAHCGQQYVSRQSRQTRYCSVDCFRVAIKGRPLRPALDRFWEKVNKDGPIPEHRPDLGPCWVWMAGTDAHGYGHFWSERYVGAHIWAYTTFVGPVGDGLELDHLCRRVSCCNPSHLEPVTHQENIRRGYAARRTTEV